VPSPADPRAMRSSSPLELVLIDVAANVKNADDIDPPCGWRVEDDVPRIDPATQPRMQIVASSTEQGLFAKHFEVVPQTEDVALGLGIVPRLGRVVPDLVEIGDGARPKAILAQRQSGSSLDDRLTLPARSSVLDYERWASSSARSEWAIPRRRCPASNRFWSLLTTCLCDDGG
jgi:hypothetical protein